MTALKSEGLSDKEKEVARHCAAHYPGLQRGGRARRGTNWVATPDLAIAAALDGEQCGRDVGRKAMSTAPVVVQFALATEVGAERFADNSAVAFLQTSGSSSHCYRDLDPDRTHSIRRRATPVFFRLPHICPDQARGMDGRLGNRRQSTAHRGP